MTRRQRILLTARSACAAWGMIELWRVLRTRADVDLRLLAQQPAVRIFHAESIPCIDVGLPHAIAVDSPEAARLLDYAASEVGAFAPDAVLAGLSTPNEGGIDEAVIVKARCPSFVLQDFWGDCNLFYGRHADCYLASDAYGEEQTMRRHGARAVAVGSPRHARYAGIDFEALRQHVLGERGLDASLHYPGLFTQPLFELPGYVKTLEAWSSAVARLAPGTSVIYRPHPACSPRQVALVRDVIAGQGLAPVTISDGPVENAIAACSSIASAISNANFDAVYVNYFARSPKAVPVYLLWERDLAAYLGGMQDLDAMPLVQWGMARSVRHAAGLEAALVETIDPAARTGIWKSASGMPDPVAAVDTVIDMLMRPAVFV